MYVLNFVHVRFDAFVNMISDKSCSRKEQTTSMGLPSRNVYVGVIACEDLHRFHGGVNHKEISLVIGRDAVWAEHFIATLRFQFVRVRVLMRRVEFHDCLCVAIAH